MRSSCRPIERRVDFISDLCPLCYYVALLSRYLQLCSALNPKAVQDAESEKFHDYARASAARTQQGLSEHGVAIGNAAECAGSPVEQWIGRFKAVKG
jgi:hypothetical protein